MLNFLHKPKPVFGLDISGDAFKIAYLKNDNKRFNFKALAKVYFPKGVMVNDMVSDFKTFEHLVKESFEKPLYGHIDTNHAVVSLPESKSFVRVIQIPLMSDVEAEAAIPFEAENFIPMPIDQVYLDWQKLSVVGDKLNILIIASPKEFVDRYLEILDKMDLKVIALEVESQSVVRALLPQNNQETLLIADIQSARSNLIMLEEGNLQFTSSVPIAGNAFTESIARSLGVSSAKAEEIKKKAGVANTPDYPNIKINLLPVLNSLIAEIKGILKFHSEHSDKQVTKIVLSGGGAKLKNLPDFISPNFSELKVELGNPFLNLINLKDAPFDPYEALSYTTAIGLALRKTL